MNISQLKTTAPFNALFPGDPEVLGKVQDHMEAHGYDESQPIIIWKDRNVVVDGHTRLQAAKNLGVDDVPVVEKEFRDEEEALEYAIHNQRDRRNLTDADILRCIEVLDRPRSRGGDRKSDKAKSMPSCGGIEKRSASAKETATVIGTSPRKVERTRTVLNHAPEEVKEEVLQGKKSINKAYQETQSARREPTEADGSVFGRTHDDFNFATWSWSPLFSCKHEGCLCKSQGIEPEHECHCKPYLIEEALTAPQNTPVPLNAHPRERLVVVGPVIDLFDEEVSPELVEAVLEAVQSAPLWNFLFMTDSLHQLVEIDLPANAWVGTRVTRQAQVQAAEEAFLQSKASIKFVVCEPLEPLEFSSMTTFDWVIVSVAKPNPGTSEQPPWKWVESILWQAREAGCKVFFKPGLTVRPQEYPQEAQGEPAENILNQEAQGVQQLDTFLLEGET